MEKAIGLVVVRSGYAEIHAPLHVDIRVVDLDDIERGGEQPALPAGRGFERLAEEAGVTADVVFGEEPCR